MIDIGFLLLWRRKTDVDHVDQPQLCRVQFLHDRGGGAELLHELVIGARGPAALGSRPAASRLNMIDIRFSLL